jgi:hypothetical protein
MPKTSESTSFAKDVPGSSLCNALSLDVNAPPPEPPHNEVWGVPWISGLPFKGLASSWR